MNATPMQINTNRTNAKRLRTAGFHAEADAYDATADDLQAEWNELERRRIAAKHSAVNPEAQPDFSRAAFKRDVIARRHSDMTGSGWPLQQIINTVNDTREAERARVQASVTATAENLADWMAEVWPTLPEIAY